MAEDSRDAPPEPAEETDKQTAAPQRSQLHPHGKAQAPEQEAQPDEQDAGDQGEEDPRPVKACQDRRHENGNGGDDQKGEHIKGDLFHKAGYDFFGVFPVPGGAEQEDEDQDPQDKA